MNLLIEFNIPSYGVLKLEHLVIDVNGTLTVDGKLPELVKEKLIAISQIMKVHVLTANTFGSAMMELAQVPCAVNVLVGGDTDKQKEAYVKGLGHETVAAFGNGRNDRLMLKAAMLSVAVIGREGCATEALLAADVCVCDIVDGLGLLLEPKRLEATLRL